MKYILFGTGDYYERYKHWFDKGDVLALLDNSVQKQNTQIDGIKVVSPEKGVCLPYDAIIILSFYVKEMKQQLMNLGAEQEKIYHFFDLYKLLKIRKSFQLPIEYKRENSILLLSQDLTLGGPAIALFHAAEVLKKQGYFVVYASMLDGPLRKQLVAANIPVVVDNNLQIGTMQDCPWTTNFSLIICNTIQYHIFLSERDLRIPVIWWLHDSSFYYDGVDRQFLQRLDFTNMKVISVGSIPKNAIQNFVPNLDVKGLLYGVQDGYVPNQYNPTVHDRLCFVTIGYVVEHKAQDILIKAIRKLEGEMKEKADFYIVGQDFSMMAQNLKKETKDLVNVYFTGPMDREQISRILEWADVLICPSRQDSMPTVCAEAMMHETACLVSDATGTAGYIEDGINGLIFQSENIQMLAEKIEWCIKHRGNLHHMGTQARKVYDTYFSMQVFEKELKKLVDTCFST